MKQWIKQLSRILVVTLAIVCLCGYLSLEADAASYSGGTWIKGATTYWYEAPNGDWPANGWHQVDGAWYYFDSNGNVKTTHNSNNRAGWICEDASKNAYFYVNPTGGAGTIGKMQTGWVETNQGWFYLTPTAFENYQRGQMLHSRWQLIDGSYYHFATTGIMDTYWYNDANGYFYLGSNGKMVTGLQTLSAVDGRPAGTYYFKTTDGNKGVMLTGWHKVSGKWYYFNPANNDGRSITNTIKVTNTVKGANVTCSYTVTVWSGGSTKEQILQKTFTLSNGQSWTSDAVPTNAIYTVTQTTPSGYTTTGATSNNTLTSNETVAFTNTQQLKLTVKKVVSGGTARADKEYDFSVKIGSSTYTFKLKKDGTWTSGSFPYGSSYSVTETDYSGQGISTTNRTVTGTLNTNATVTVTNTQQEQTLTIKNTVRGVGQAYKYTVTAKYADGTTYTVPNGTFTLNAGGAQNITLPKNATYTVTQTAVNGYLTEGNATRTGTMSANATVEFINTQQVTLKVTNTVVGADKSFKYTVTINGKAQPEFTLSNGGSWTSDTFPHGTSYIVTQTSDDGYSTNSTGAQGTLAAGVTAAFTNTQKKYNLTLSNTVIGEDAGITYAVTIGTEDKGTFTLTHGGTQVFENIPHGTTYSITRTDDLGYLTDDGVTRSGTLTQAATVTYVNRQLVPLTVTNEIIGKEDDFSYTITFGNGTNHSFVLKNGSETYPNAPCGLSYTVSQTPDDDYETTVPENYTGEVASGITVAFKNTQTPKLTVKNTVHGATPEEPFSYTVVIGDGEPIEFTLAPGAIWTSDKFLLGTPYSVTQTSNAAYHTTEPDNINGALDDNVDVEFVNRELVSLTVSNTISGADTDFTYSVVIGGVDQGPVTLGNGDTKVFENIPFGTPYTVTQTTPDGYRNNGADTVNGTVESGTKAEFSNTQMLTLTVTNTVEGADGEFAYVVTINGEDQGEIKLTNGGTWTSEAYPYDAEYTVVQTAPEGTVYDTTKTDSHSGKLTDDATVAFTNVQMLKLTIANQVTGADEPFTYTVMIGGELQDNIELKNGQSWTSSKYYRYDSAYTVGQALPEGLKYSTVIEGDPEATLAECTMVTYKNTQLLTLTITNQLTGEDKDFTYQVKINGVETEITLPQEDAWVYTISDILFGSTYEITQITPEGLTYETGVSENGAGLQILKEDQNVVFTNIQLVTLTLALDTTGNMANKDQEFEFVVTVGEDTETVKLVDDGIWNKTVHFGTAYSITQTAVEGYETSINGEKREEADSYTTEGALAGDTAVTFTNEKGFAIPTAVTLTVLPFLGMVLFGGGIGITQLLGGRKSRRGRYLDR